MDIVTKMAVGGSVAAMRVFHAGTLVLQRDVTTRDILDEPSTELHVNAIKDVKCALGIRGESSVVYIAVDGKHVLVDTGFQDEWNVSEANKDTNKKSMQRDLDLIGLNFEDINEIFITHFHHDHFGNVDLFPNAQVFFSGMDEMNARSLFNFCEIPNVLCKLGPKDTWHAGIVVIPTPGHTGHHNSLVVDFKGVKVVVAGDAIVAQTYYDRDEIWSMNTDFHSREMALASMASIVDMADIIIPGHGPAFENYRTRAHGGT